VLFQFPVHILPYAILIDLTLLGTLWLSTRPVKRTHQRIIFGTTVLGFIGFGLFKVLFTAPHPIASTPVDLEIRTPSTFASLYYLGYDDDIPNVFWKEHIIGKEKLRSFDLESQLENGLTIASKFDGEWLSKTIEWNGKIVNSICLQREFFEPANLEVVNAIQHYIWTERGNYFSNFLTLIFMVLALMKGLKC